ncbi:MAG: HAD family phosphatase [Abditibacteriaceae bacterium]
MAIQAIIFDMDGVLADSEPLWNDIDAAFLQNFNIEYHGEHKLHVMGKSFSLSSQFYKEHYKLEMSVSEMVKLRAETAREFYASRIELFPHVPEVLIKLREMHLQIGLATSTVRECALPLLERHDIKKYFHKITTGDEVERGKPYPDIYLRAAGKLCVEADAALVVEDSPTGIEAGQCAGMLVAAIPDRRIPDIDQLVQNADFILDGIADLPKLLGTF